MAVERQAGPAGLSFSNSLRVQEPSGTWIYVSGQFGTDEAGAITPGGLAAESKAALDNVLKAVREAGGTAADVVKITAYLTSLDDYRRYNEVRQEVFAPKLPTSTAVAVAGLILREASIEIDAVAFVPNDEGRRDA
ncbi:MAG TPA: RidA family protein [Streptosporangiaceae bacterium]|nr:RidA family protein [Streptosporangiaceae bacterium]